jgi:hypothetical protein
VLLQHAPSPGLRRPLASAQFLECRARAVEYRLKGRRNNDNRSRDIRWHQIHESSRRRASALGLPTLAGRCRSTITSHAAEEKIRRGNLPFPRYALRSGPLSQRHRRAPSCTVVIRLREVPSVWISEDRPAVIRHACIESEEGMETAARGRTHHASCSRPGTSCRSM